MRRYLRNNRIRIPLYNDRERCIFCNARLLYNANTRQMSGQYVLPSIIPKLYLDHNILVHTNNKYCEDIHDINTIHLIPTQRISDINDNVHLKTYHRSLLLINHHISTHYKSKSDIANDAQTIDPCIAFDTSSDARIQSLSRLTREQILELSALCNVEPNVLFLFYTICYKDWSYSTVQSIFGFPIMRLMLSMIHWCHNNCIKRGIETESD
eukprot:79488_1